MSFIAAAIIGGAGLVGGIGSALIGSSAAQSASAQQVALGQQALGQQQKFFNIAQKNVQPFVNAAVGDNGQGGVLGTLEQFTQPGANMTSTLSQLPGFQFAQDWGQKAITNQGTTMGLGGNTLTAGAQYATGLAQQNWQQYLNPLLQIYGQGASAAGQLANTAQGFSGQASGTLQNIGQAQAAGTLGAANAWSGAVGGAGNTAANALLLGRYLNSPNNGPPGQYAYPNSPYTSAFGRG